MSDITLPRNPAMTFAKSIPFWRQIRWNLVLYLVLIVSIPMGIVATLILQRTEEQIRNGVFNQLESVAELKSAQIEDFLVKGNEDLHSVSVAYDEPIAAIVAESAAERDSATLNQAFENFVSVHAALDEVFLYDLDGNVIATSDPNDLGKVITRQPYYDSSLWSDIHTEPPYFDIGIDRLALVVTHRVVAEDSSVLGVMAARLDVDTLGSIMLERTGLGETGETYLVSQDNRYLLTPSRAEGYSLNRAYQSEGISQALNGESGSGTYSNYRAPAEVVLGVYRWVPKLRVALLAEVNEDEVLAPSRATTRTGLVITAVIILIVSAIGLGYATYITRPILTLTSTVEQITGGDLSIRTRVRQKNEVGKLASSFNRMTDRLSATINELDQKVDHIAEINKDLQRANAQAHEAIRLKSEFLATMSHELRTPLNAMIGFTGIMLQGMGGEIDADAQHMIMRIEANSKRLLGLINDVLDVAKIEAGRVDVVSVPIKLRDLTEQWYSETSVLAEQKQLDFEMSVSPDVPDYILGDPERLTQVANNLLSNAFKFTDAGSVKLEVMKQDTSWLLRVVDTGVGIPPHALNYIFEEFRQLDGSSTRAYGGSGLGLAITRNLCRLMDGHIRADSTLGQGSIFTVTLPLKVVEPEPAII